MRLPELMEERLCLSGLSFATYEVASNKSGFPESVAIGDFNGDGLDDVLVASGTQGVISLLIRNGDEYESQLVTDDNDGRPFQIAPADVDSDGALDVVATLDRGIGWFRNTDGRGRFGGFQMIAESSREFSGLHVSDLDGDDDADLIVGSSVFQEVFWFENDGQGVFGSGKLIVRNETEALLAFDVADMDGDGDADVAVAFSGDSESSFSWYENNGNGGFGSLEVISEDIDWAGGITINDVDDDGHADIIFKSLTTLSLYNQNVTVHGPV